VQSLNAQHANCDLFFQEKQSSGSTVKPEKLFFALMRLCSFWNFSHHRYGRVGPTCALCWTLSGDHADGYSGAEHSNPERMGLGFPGQPDGHLGIQERIKCKAAKETPWHARYTTRFGTSTSSTPKKTAPLCCTSTVTSSMK